jgi:hypothetical protein
MYRRDFLKLSGLLSAAALMPFNSLAKAVSSPAEVDVQGRLYRGTSDGKIFISPDAGKTWQLHTNFGSDFSIVHLGLNFWGELEAQLGFAGNSFEVALGKNGKAWKAM